MANTSERKNWVFTPSQDFEPDKSLTLGQILEDAFQPASALIPQDVIVPPPGLIRDKISKKGVEFQFEDNLSSSFAAYCEAKGLPLSASLQGRQTKDSEATWQLESLDSETFLPSMGYVKAVLGSGDVSTKTQWWKARRRIYMVTGVRIAKGGRKHSTSNRTTQFGGVFGVDGSQINVPARVGAQAQHESSLKQTEETEGITNFIFAYRLSEVTYRVWISHKPITYGHTASRQHNQRADKAAEEGDDENQLPEPDGYEVSGLDEMPFDEEEADPRVVW
jgi:hypothetical protein